MNEEQKRVFEELKAISKNLKLADEEQIRNVIKILFSKMPINIVDFHKGREIERAVGNSNDSELHTSVSRLSYKPAELNETNQRASLQGKTMFYGSALFLGGPSSEKEIMYERIIGCSEANELLREDMDGENYMTFAKWDVIEDIPMACFIDPHKKYDSDYLTKIQSNQNKFIEEKIQDKEDIEFVKDIYSFISNEFSKKVSEREDYIISALISDLLASHSYGIYYPSVQAYGQGMCVAIPPNTADQKLQFKKALICRIEKSKKNISIENSYIGILNNGKIEYTQVN